MQTTEAVTCFLCDVMDGVTNANPGVNVLTRHVRVHPYTLADFACGCVQNPNMPNVKSGMAYGVTGMKKLNSNVITNVPAMVNKASPVAAPRILASSNSKRKYYCPTSSL